LVFIGFFVAINFHSTILDTRYGTVELSEVVIGMMIIKNTDIQKEKIFHTMVDIENYPNILPKNIISVKILNVTNTSFEKIIYAEEKLVESGITTTVIVRHSIVDNQGHEIQVMSGDAKGTVIKQTFREINNGTEIKTDIQIRIGGILAPFGALTSGNMESALNTALDNFIQYSKNIS